MGKNINKCEIEGNIGKELSLRYMPNGKAVLNFSVACSNDYFDKDKNDWVNQTDWADCVAFDKIAESIAQKCSKGSYILITDSRYKKRAYQDKNSGDTRYSHEFIINEWRPLAAASSNDQASNPQQQANQQQNSGYPSSNGQANDLDFDEKIPY